MGLFFKKNKNQEKNEINNKELNENLANTALKMLVNGMDYEEVLYTTCEFGYLYIIDGHGLEALFKITTDKGTFFFAAQGNSLQRLEFNDQLFIDTTDKFLSIHQ